MVKEKKIRKKKKYKYRVVLLNESTFEEQTSFSISKLSFTLVILLCIGIVATLTTLLFLYTPLKTYIPGYTTAKFKTETTKLNLQLDSLQNIAAINNAYYRSIQKVLKGETDSIYKSKDTAYYTDQNNLNLDDLFASKNDSILREKVEREDKFNVFEQAVFDGNFTLFQPVKGIVSDTFNLKTKHYAVDIATDKNQSVKAVANGRVIFSEWTADTGFVIIIEHKFSLISVYKHNASLLKSQGDFVASGEVIALTGNTGQYSTGTHLHFELWSDGNPINPLEFLTFN